MEASNPGTLSKGINISLHAVQDCPNGRTAAIARHMSFAQITCFSNRNCGHGHMTPKLSDVICQHNSKMVKTMGFKFDMRVSSDNPTHKC